MPSLRISWFELIETEIINKQTIVVKKMNSNVNFSKQMNTRNSSTRRRDDSIIRIEDASITGFVSSRNRYEKVALTCN